jgi:hypothetical protein
VTNSRNRTWVNSVEGPQHANHDLSIEAAVLLHRESFELVPAEPFDKRVDIDEVTSRGTAEQRERLVSSKLTDAQGRAKLGRHRCRHPRIKREIHERAVLVTTDLKPDETLRHAQPLNCQTIARERGFQAWEQLDRRLRTRREEVKVVRQTVDHPMRNESSPASESELPRLGHAAQQSGNADL